jgi:hypothetical protein
LENLKLVEEDHPKRMPGELLVSDPALLVEFPRRFVGVGEKTVRRRPHGTGL